MLGSGFVTRPTLDILSDAGIEVSVGLSHNHVAIGPKPLMMFSLQNT
jgi:hypothetical protein